MLSIRKISAAGFSYRHFSRYRQILSVLFKYGFEDVLGAFKIDKYLSCLLRLISRKRGRLMADYSRFERLRMALEELGPTFIKLGQALSMRPDFVSMEFINELTKLQDMVPPCDFELMKPIIEGEFNSPLPELYRDFDTTPLASASIGQVYRARLKDGRQVAVKVQRPGLDRLVAVDLGIMFHLAGMLERHVTEFAFIRPVMIVEEFARTIVKELDYTVEATHLERFARNFHNDPTVHIPRVHRPLTTRRVLTMEYIDGIKASDIASLDAAGMDRKLITRRGAELLLKQTFDHGFFHADPHPGNIFILPQHVIALLDFGQVGAVDQQSKEDFVDLIDSVVHQNPFKATRQLLKITRWEQKPELRRLEKDVAEFIGKHLYKPLKDLNISTLIQDLLYLVSRYQLRIPPDIYLMMKSLGTIEGIARQLDPDFDMIEHATPFIRQIKVDRLKPQRLADDLYTLTGEFVEFAKQFPTDMMEISRLIKEHQISLRMDEKSLKALQGVHNRTGNRVVMAILVAALLIASALVMETGLGPMVFGLPFPSAAGLAAAGVLGLWVLIAVARGGGL